MTLRVVPAAWLFACVLAAVSPAAAQSTTATFDLVVANGRVIDPETGLDGIRSVGIRSGRIEVISETPLTGRTVLDARGLVVAREGRPINYGFSASWLYARIAEKEGMEPTGSVTFFQEAQRRDGWQHTYAPGHGRKEAFAVAQLAARAGVPAFIPVRYMSVIEPQSSFEAMAEVVALAAATGAHVHIHHLNSMSLRDIPRIAELLRGAQARGVRITTEAYPYGGGSTVVGAELFRGNWRERLGGATAGDIELAGVPFTDATLAEAQAKTPGAWVVAHFLRPDRRPADQEFLDQAVLFPGGAIASDAMPWTSQGQAITGDVWPLPDDAFAHPRSAGTFTRFLREYVRERPRVALTEGLRRMTLIPAQLLETSVPQMKRKGRLQVGADADLVAFDLATVSDRGTYAEPNQHAVGMRYVIVNGTPVIRDGQLVRDALPGKPIRRPVSR